MPRVNVRGSEKPLQLSCCSGAQGHTPVSSSVWFSLGVGAKTVECKPSAFCSLATSTGCGHGSQRDQGWAPGSATTNAELRAKSLTPGLLKCRMGLSAPAGEPCGDE